ncbi:MAG: SUMF1/EgtB/PvdO family nonheme iron enzyme [Polyangiales bacterium]
MVPRRSGGPMGAMTPVTRTILLVLLVQSALAGCGAPGATVDEAVDAAAPSVSIVDGGPRADAGSVAVNDAPPSHDASEPTDAALIRDAAPSEDASASADVVMEDVGVEDAGVDASVDVVMEDASASVDVVMEDASVDAAVEDAAVEDAGVVVERCPPGMAYVAGGTFTMGDDADPAARPAHRVSVSGFCVDRTEVTVAAYRACPGDVCDPPATTQGCNWGVDGRDAQPVNCVSWPAAESFCAWRGGALPTEAQWERAARGDDGRVFPWGEAGPSGRACWSGDVARAATCAVGSFATGASPLGLDDMAGDVAEWTKDWFAPYAPVGAVARDPVGPSSGERRVVRGGSFTDASPDALRVTARRGDVVEGDATVGFRCVIPACEGDGCASACEAGSHLCQGRCVDTHSIATCGDRCSPCEAPPHARATCVAGGCGYTCAEGWSDCDGDVTNGCELAVSVPDTGACPL